MLSGVPLFLWAPLETPMSDKTKRITVSFVDDNSRLQEKLAQYIDTLPDIVCASTHDSAEQAIMQIPAIAPQVVLMDINLPGMSGIEAVSRLKPVLPTCEFVMLTVYEEPERIFRSLRAGATGYLLKTTSLDEIVAGIRDITHGGTAMSAVVARRLIRHFNEQPMSAPEVGKLSAREFEIVDLLAKGLGNKQIADQLGLSPGTVRNYLRSVYRKLHVSTRTEAVVRFFGHDGPY